MTLSVIIVSYNVRHYLAQCLHSVWHAIQGIDAEVIVVDNASHDDTVLYLRTCFPETQYPQLRIVESLENLGFGKANNLAADQARGQYLLFLNPDTILTEHTLYDCITFAEEHPDLGALGVKMLRDNGLFAHESRRGLPSPWTAFCKMSGLATLFPHSTTFGRYYMRYLDKGKYAPIDIVSGAFMFIPRRAADKTGLFDEQFFMYGEDIDLSYRLLLEGFQNYYLPTPILHYKGESTSKTSFRYIHNFYKAMLLFFRKHYRQTSVLLAIPVQLAIVGRAVLALLGQPWCYYKKYFFRATKSTELSSEKLLTYTADEVTYTEMLASLEHSDHTRYLAIRHPQWGMLIMGGDVISIPDTATSPCIP